MIQKDTMHLDPSVFNVFKKEHQDINIHSFIFSKRIILFRVMMCPNAMLMAEVEIHPVRDITLIHT